ncbi:hypothetical protein B0H13DRAFT_1936168 [Mycena leptocephala]|nr:hypothetical protein B0H13DRAFT_1936168 [Mycena leptocephala]
MSTSLPPLDSITGELRFSSPPLVGTWASSRLATGQLLYTAEMLQAVYYFRNFKNDYWMLKMIVTVAFVIDTVPALGDYAAAYLAVPLYIISTSCVAILVQIFLAFRYWRLPVERFLEVFHICGKT